MSSWLRPFVRHSGVGAVLVLVACSSDRSTGPTASEPLDLTSTLSAMAVPGLGAAASFVPTASAAGFGAPAVVPAACAYSAATGSFNCPVATVGGLTVSTSFTLYDASGKSQSQPDKNTTASVRVVTTTAGTLAPPSGVTPLGPTTINGSQDMTLSGLLTGNRLLNGSGTSTIASSVTLNGTTTPVTIAETEETTNVALPPAGGASSWPLSGTVTMNVTSSFGGAVPLSTKERIQLTFDGTSIATVTITSGLGTETCHIDLSGKTAPSCAP